MSERVVTHVLLDFGRSLWNDSLLFEEFPDKLPEFENTGKYGIGFFSIFMLGQNLKITTRRYEAARNETLVMEFIGGLGNRPIIRKANFNEYLRDGGSVFEIELQDKSFKEILTERFRNTDGKMTLTQLIKYIAPASEVDINVEYEGRFENAIKANDWLHISAEEIYNRIESYESGENIDFKTIDSMLEIIEIHGKKIARVCLPPKTQRYNSPSGSLVVGGFASNLFSGIFGFVKASPSRASRDEAIPLLTGSELANFFDRQWIYFADSTDDIQYNMSDTLHSFRYSRSDLKCFIIGNTYANLIDLENFLASKKPFYFFSHYDLSKSVEDLTRIDNLQVSAMTCDESTSYPISGGLFRSRWNVDNSAEFGLSSFDIFANAISVKWGFDLETVKAYRYRSRRNMDVPYGTYMGDMVFIREGILFDLSAIQEFAESLNTEK